MRNAAMITTDIRTVLLLALRILLLRLTYEETVDFIPELLLWHEWVMTGVTWRLGECESGWLVMQFVPEESSLIIVLLLVLLSPPSFFLPLFTVNFNPEFLGTMITLWEEWTVTDLPCSLPASITAWHVPTCACNSIFSSSLWSFPCSPSSLSSPSLFRFTRSLLPLFSGTLLTSSPGRILDLRTSSSVSSSATCFLFFSFRFSFLLARIRSNHRLVLPFGPVSDSLVCSTSVYCRDREKKRMKNRWVNRQRMFICIQDCHLCLPVQSEISLFPIEQRICHLYQMFT